MTIEIRELVIRSEVVERGTQGVTPGSSSELSSVLLQRLKAEVLASCREWLADRLQRERER